MFRTALRGRAPFAPLVATTVALAVALSIAPAVLADTHIGDYGAPGAHKLRDTARKPGVTCKYRSYFEDAGGWSGKLVRLTVRPPKVWGKSGVKSVAWLFEAQRRAGLGGAWVTTYTSSAQYAYPAPGRLASFSSKTVRVRVPSDFITTTYTYRVNVYMYWYYKDRSAAMSEHRVDFYRHKNAYGRFDGLGQCIGYAYILP